MIGSALCGPYSFVLFLLWRIRITGSTKRASVLDVIACDDGSQTRRSPPGDLSQSPREYQTNDRVRLVRALFICFVLADGACLVRAFLIGSR